MAKEKEGRGHIERKRTATFDHEFSSDGKRIRKVTAGMLVVKACRCYPFGKGLAGDVGWRGAGKT